MINIENLISQAKQAILDNNGEYTYLDMGRYIKGENCTPEEQAVNLLALSVICHNIPYYEKNVRKIRELFECLIDTITFYNSNKAETEIVLKSNTDEKVDWLTGYKMPKLTFGDDSHYVFKSGSGGSRPDLQDETGITYEVKRNYRGGSRASLHTAQYLIDCKNTTIEIRPIGRYGEVDLEHSPLGRFNGYLEPKILRPTALFEEELLEILLKGNLITEVEKLLEEASFCWNP